MIRLSPVSVGQKEEALVLEVLRSGHLVQGPMVERLEEGFRELCEVYEAVAVSNGTIAIVAALQALGIGPGDEVVTSPFTFAASLNAILEVGATARFVDILDDYTIDPEALESAVTPRTAAIIPVHLYGYPADMNRIRTIATNRGIAVVEDAAQAHGAAVSGQPVGSFGIGCFSLYATKNLMTGEGGLVTTNDRDVADRLRLLRNQGMRHRYEYEVPGHNYRLTDIQAALGIPQLAELKEANQRRRRNAARLSEGLSDVAVLRVPLSAPDRTHVFHQFTIRVTSESPVGRDLLAAGLARLGIETGVFYPRVVYDYPCYRSHPLVTVAPMGGAERSAQEVLSLPVHPGLTDGDIDRTVEAIRLLMEKPENHVSG